jgi:hypothetical protein
MTTGRWMKCRLRVVVQEAARVPLAQLGVLLGVQDERVEAEVHVIRRDHGDVGGGRRDHEGERLVRDALGTLGRLPVVGDHEVGEALEQLLTCQRATGLLNVRGPAGIRSRRGCRSAW